MNNKIATILPEPFVPGKSGALTIWTKEVYALLDVKSIVLCPYSRNRYQYPNSIGFPVHVFVLLGKIFSFIKPVSIFFKHILFPIIASVYCRLMGYNIIHVQNRPTYIIWLKRIHPKSKVYLHLQNDHFQTLTKKEQVGLFDAVDRIIAVSEYIRKGVIANGVKALNWEQKTVTLHSGVNHNAIKRTTGISKKVSILYIGRIVREKGVIELIKAFNDLNKEINNIELKVVGSSGFGKSEQTSYLQGVQKESEKNPNILLLGSMSHEELPPELDKASILVVPSLWNEPFGLVVLEGMAAGKAVIGSQFGAIPEILADTGRLIDPNNHIQFVDTLRELAVDEDLRLKLGIRARERSERHFTWDLTAARLKVILGIS